jgi:hypothetical protein
LEEPLLIGPCGIGSFFWSAKIRAAMLRSCLDACGSERIFAAPETVLGAGFCFSDMSLFHKRGETHDRVHRLRAGLQQSASERLVSSMCIDTNSGGRSPVYSGLPVDNP